MARVPPAGAQLEPAEEHQADRQQQEAAKGQGTQLELLLRAFCDDVVHKAFGYVLALTLPHFLAQADAQMDFVKDSMAMLFVCQMDLLFEGSKSFELVFSERDSATRGG